MLKQSILNQVNVFNWITQILNTKEIRKKQTIFFTNKLSAQNHTINIFFSLTFTTRRATGWFILVFWHPHRQRRRDVLAQETTTTDCTDGSLELTKPAWGGGIENIKFKSLFFCATCCKRSDVLRALTDVIETKVWPDLNRLFFDFRRIFFLFWIIVCFIILSWFSLIALVYSIKILQFLKFEKKQAKIQHFKKN